MIYSYCLTKYQKCWICKCYVHARFLRTLLCYIYYGQLVHFIIIGSLHTRSLAVMSIYLCQSLLQNLYKLWTYVMYKQVPQMMKQLTQLKYKWVQKCDCESASLPRRRKKSTVTTNKQKPSTGSKITQVYTIPDLPHHKGHIIYNVTESSTCLNFDFLTP